MNVRLPERNVPRKEQPSGATWLALVFLVLCGGGFIALTSLILPQIRGLILVVGGMGGFMALHYVTWGRWLLRVSRDAREQFDDDWRTLPNNRDEFDAD